MRLRGLFAALLLSLPGCAAVLPRNAPAPVVETRAYAVPVSVKKDLGVRVILPTGLRFIAAWGITTTLMDGTPVKVEFDAAMADRPALARMVAAHEFGHVLGVDRHDGTCPWMVPSIGGDTPLVTDPCEDTVTRARARSSGKVYALVLEPDTPPEFVAAITWAAARWNRILDRGAFVVRTAPEPAATPQPKAMPSPPARGGT